MTAPQDSRRRWRNYLLDRGYQIGSSAFTVGLCGLLYIALALWADHSGAKATAVVVDTVVAMDCDSTGGPSATHDDRSQCEATKTDTIRRLRTNRYQTRLVLVGGGAVFCLGLIATSVVLTHRVAGPLNKLTAMIIKHGFNAGPVTVRKGDQLIGFVHQFNAACAGVQQIEEQAAADLAHLVSAVQKTDLAARSPKVAQALAAATILANPDGK